MTTTSIPAQDVLPFGYLPRTREVAVWFGRHGLTLNDVPSFRNQISVVEAEMAAARRDGVDWRAAGLTREADELAHSLLAAEALVGRMQDRIAALGVQPDPIAARLVSDMARILDVWGDDALEGSGR